MGVQALAGPFAATPGVGREPGGETQSRDALKSTVFKILDCDGNGLINEQEFLPFSRSHGYDGSSEEWTAEFDLLCHYVGCNAAFGIGEAAFGRLLDDNSAEGCATTNEELLAFITEFTAKVAKKTEAAIHARFGRLDVAGPATPARQNSTASTKGRPGGKSHQRGNAWSARSQFFQAG